MKNHAVFPALALAGGGAAFALRLAQDRTGFESATGLPVAASKPVRFWARRRAKAAAPPARTKAG